MHQIPEREDGFLRAVLELASALGWHAFHPRPARTAHGWTTALSGDAGYVDLTLAKAGHPLILAELKTARGRISPAQQAWLDVLSQTEGHLIQVWRPAYWDAIEALLRRE